MPLEATWSCANSHVALPQILYPHCQVAHVFNQQTGPVKRACELADLFRGRWGLSIELVCVLRSYAEFAIK